MAKNRKNHDNNEARTIAPERAEQLLEDLTAMTMVVKGYRRRMMLLDGLAVGIVNKALAAHARATLDRAKRRAK